jgi:hypothetical protein
MMAGADSSSAAAEDGSIGRLPSLVSNASGLTADLPAKEDRLPDSNGEPVAAPAE